MAFQKSNGGLIPHATNYSNLLDILVTFAVAQGWVIIDDQRATAGAYIILKGLDYTGTGSIYVAIKKYGSAGIDTYGWILNGYTGYTGAGFYNEPGSVQMGTYLPAVPMWNDQTPYWLSVNPRRIVLVTNVSGVYVSMYLGLMLPYGSTGQWQYPLVVAGSNITNNGGTTTPRYSDTSNNMTVPFIPFGNGNQSNFALRTANGEWIDIYNGSGSVNPLGVALSTPHGISPYIGGWANCRANLDNKYPLRTLRVFRFDSPDAYGVLDGVKYVPGHLLSSEDTMTEGANNYTVFQNTFRTTPANFFALQES